MGYYRGEHYDPAEIHRFHEMTLTDPRLKKEAKNFGENWISQIEEKLHALKSSEPPQISVWEGYVACQEIKKAGDLWVVLPQPETQGYPFAFLMEKLSREVYFYKLYEQKIIPTNQGFQKAIDALTVAASVLKGAESTESVAVAGLSGDLSRCRSNFEKTLNRLKRERKSFWKRALFATPAERMTWPVFFEEDGRVISIPPDDLVKLEHTFKKADYPRDLLKRIDLDRRFQVRVATILRLYLSRHIPVPVSLQPVLGKASLASVSLKTISRLTVLTYFAGSLGPVKGARLILNRRKQPITVRSVDEIIRKAGIR